MKTIIGASLALLLLAGCSGKGGAGNNSSSVATGDQQGSEPANDAQDMQNIAIPVTPPSPTPIASIPADFQGRWGLVDRDCNPANAAIAKGLMTIAGDRLSFYEARGTATHLRQLTQGTITFDLPMSGEGQRWAEPTRLTVQDGGRVLVRQATGPKDRAGAFTYQRCPA